MWQISMIRTPNDQKSATTRTKNQSQPSNSLKRSFPSSRKNRAGRNQQKEANTIKAARAQNDQSKAERKPSHNNQEGRGKNTKTPCREQRKTAQKRTAQKTRQNHKKRGRKQHQNSDSAKPQKKRTQKKQPQKKKQKRKRQTTRTKPLTRQKTKSMKLNRTLQPRAKTNGQHHNKGPPQSKSLTSATPPKHQTENRTAIGEQTRPPPKPNATHATTEIGVCPPDNTTSKTDNQKKARVHPNTHTSGPKDKTNVKRNRLA
ncbi:hypothetical protein G97194_004739 [Escherichia coli]|nr:hypothetical protein G97194_004739 [Escherichia coli]